MLRWGGWSKTTLGAWRTACHNTMPESPWNSIPDALFNPPKLADGGFAYPDYPEHE